MDGALGRDLSRVETEMLETTYPNGMTWKMCADYAAERGGRLLTLSEARDLMSGFAIRPGEDSWAAVTLPDECGWHRDWIQVGDKFHLVGKSHVKNHGYPDWGDSEGADREGANMYPPILYRSLTEAPTKVESQSWNFNDAERGERYEEHRYQLTTITGFTLGMDDATRIVEEVAKGEYNGESYGAQLDTTTGRLIVNAWDGMNNKDVKKLVKNVSLKGCLPDAVICSDPLPNFGVPTEGSCELHVSRMGDIVKSAMWDMNESERGSEEYELMEYQITRDTGFPKQAFDEAAKIVHQVGTGQWNGETYGAQLDVTTGKLLVNACDGMDRKDIPKLVKAAGVPHVKT
jgi:hypothetical protein